MGRFKKNEFKFHRRFLTTTNRQWFEEALTVLYSVVKHINGAVEHERIVGGNTRRSRVFFPTS